MQIRIKLPSAKSIIRTYKKLGKVFDKKKIINRKVRSKKSELSETENQLFSEEFKEKAVEEAKEKNI